MPRFRAHTTPPAGFNHTPLPGDRDALRRTGTRAVKQGRLRIDDPRVFSATVARLYDKNWVVYCKRPFGGPEQVIRYLGQYTHRIALANQRLLEIDERGVTFRTKNGKKATVDGVTFLRRWLAHVLPPGFVKIRHHGLLSAAHATTRLELARQRLLDGSTSPAATTDDPSPTREAADERPLTTHSWRDIVEQLTGIDLGVCKRCASRVLEREPLPRWSPEPRAPPKAA